MDNSKKFLDYREEYKEFHFNQYTISEDDDGIYLEFEFEIPGLTTFNPKMKILKKSFNFKSINTEYVKNMVFHIGLIELISYWKVTCSPTIVIKCGYLTEDQIKWWKKLYYYGLGELFYTNNIEVGIEDFVTIKCETTNVQFEYETIEDTSEGYIVPIGGGKDSVVTLETLKVDNKKDYCLIVNPKTATLQCAEVAGFEYNNIIEIYRSIDRNLIDLNSKGFLNGHTPFSAMLAFLSYFVAYLLSKKYVALSNENSANESNVIGKKINHQYSKSFEFECDFENYSNEYLKAPVKYFSFLRPLNELQIAKIFSRQEKYHSVFKSCNVGSKQDIWCGHCPKCLFVYIILSPYLSLEELDAIFGKRLFEDETLMEDFDKLCGILPEKPFECVGSRDEVNASITETISKYAARQIALPALLMHYQDSAVVPSVPFAKYIKQYSKEHALNDYFESIIKDALANEGNN